MGHPMQAVFMEAAIEAFVKSNELLEKVNSTLEQQHLLRIPEKIHERLELHEVHAAHREDRLIKASASVAESAEGLLWAVRGFKPLIEDIGSKLHNLETR